MTAALTTEFAVKHGGKLKTTVHEVPKKIEEYIATTKLRTMGSKIDKLTAEQKVYLTSWNIGT